MKDGVVSSVTKTVDTQAVSIILSRKIIGFKLDLKKELKTLSNSDSANNEESIDKS